MQGRMVMIVDDDADDRGFFCEALAEADRDCLFITAVNGEHALDVLSRADLALPDYIFIDLNMPRMNGWQCITQLRKEERYRNIPVVIYTTSQVFENRKKAGELDAVHFFIKPSRLCDMVRGISYVFESEWEKMAELNKEVGF